MYLGSNEAVAPVTLRTLAARKAAGEKIVALTAYDASFGALLDANGVDFILVGDSLGNVVQGLPTTLPVTVDDMLYHCSAVARGVRRAMLAVDLPFASYRDPVTAFDNAAKLMQAGAAIVKLEGAGHVLDVIHYLRERDIPVCAHLGLTPQSVHAIGGYKVQGREPEAAAKLRADAKAAQDAGAGIVLFEMVPAALAGEITKSLTVPTIGIGAGVDCDGQILVVYDMLGLTPGKRPRFAKNFLVGHDSLADAIKAYAEAVRSRAYPTAEQSY